WRHTEHGPPLLRSALIVRLVVKGLAQGRHRPLAWPRQCCWKGLSAAKLVDDQMNDTARITGVIRFVLQRCGFDDQRAEQRRDAEHDAVRRDVGADRAVEPEAAELGP